MSAPETAAGGHPKKGPAMRWLQRILPFAVSGIALWALLANVDRQAVVNAFSWRVLQVFLPALLGYGLVTLIIESLSMLRLMDDPPESFNAWTAARIKCASYLLGIVHYTLGAGALTVLLRRRAALSVGSAASIVLLIAVTDLVVVLAFASLAMALVETGPTSVRAAVLAVAGLGFFGGLTLLRLPRSLGPLERIRQLSVFEGLRDVPLSRLTELFALRATFSACFVAMGGATFLAFDLHPTIPTLVVGMMLSALVAALPIAVAGLGTGQIAFVALFHGVAPDGELTAMSLVLAAGMISLRAAMGLVVAREFTREALVASEAEA